MQNTDISPIQSRNGVFVLFLEENGGWGDGTNVSGPMLVGSLGSTGLLTTDFGEHLVNGLLDVCGGAASPGLALDHSPATHLPAQLIEYLRDVPFSGAGRALVESTGQLSGQLLPFFCANLPGVVQVGFVSNQDESHVLGLFDLIQDVLEG